MAAGGLPACSPYEDVLGDAFASLDAAVRRAHLAPLAACGTFDVEHGSHPLTAALVALMQLPAAGRAQPVRLDVTATDRELLWMRQIGSTVLRTRQEAHGRRIVEQHHIGRIAFELDVENGALVYRQVAISAAGVPLPGFLIPHVHARVSPAGGGWRVEVAVTWRRHLVCRYSGVMEAA